MAIDSDSVKVLNVRAHIDWSCWGLRVDCVVEFQVLCIVYLINNHH